MANSSLNCIFDGDNKSLSRAILTTSNISASALGNSVGLCRHGNMLTVYQKEGFCQDLMASELTAGRVSRYIIDRRGGVEELA